VSSVKYEVDGREVSQNEFLDNALNNYHRKVMEDLIAFVMSLQEFRCAAHGQSPTVVLLEEGGANVSFALRDVCCDDLKRRVDAALAYQGPSAPPPAGH
jgi:hypothetical protein